MGKSGMHSSKSWLRRLLAQGWRNDRGNIAIISALAIVPLTMAVGMGLDVGVQHQHQEQLDGIADMTALFALNPVERGLTAQVARGPGPSLLERPNGFAHGHLQPQVFGRRHRHREWFRSEPRRQSLLLRRRVDLYLFDRRHDDFADQRGSDIGLVRRAPHQLLSCLSTPRRPWPSRPRRPGSARWCLTQVLSKAVAPSPATKTTPALDNLNNPNHITCVGDHKAEHKLSRTEAKTTSPWRDALASPFASILVNQAVTNLMSTAATTAHNNNTVYGISVSTMDYQVGQLYQTNDIYSNLSAAQGQVGTLQQLEVDHNGCVTSANCNANNAGNDQDSALDAGVATLGVPVNLNSYAGANTPGYQMYAPGQGTANCGRLAPRSAFHRLRRGDRRIVQWRSCHGPDQYFDRQLHQDQEFRYSDRLSFISPTIHLPTNSFYNSNIAPFQPNIGSRRRKSALRLAFTRK